MTVDPVPSGVRPPRSRAVAFALLTLGGLGALLFASLDWWSSPMATEGVTGNQATDSLAGVLSGAAAAGTALAALSGRRARTVLGVLIAVLAVGMGVVAVLAEPTVMVNNSWAGSVAAPPEVTGLRFAYAALALATLAGAIVLALRARTWPLRADRFARTAGRASTTAADDAADVWKAMDAGFDPTAGDSAPGPHDIQEPPGAFDPRPRPTRPQTSGRKPRDRTE